MENCTLASSLRVFSVPNRLCPNPTLKPAALNLRLRSLRKLTRHPACNFSFQSPLRVSGFAIGPNTNTPNTINSPYDDFDDEEGVGEENIEDFERWCNKHGKSLADLTDEEFRKTIGIRVEKISALSAEDHAGLDNPLKVDLHHNAGQQSDLLSSLSPAVMKRVLVLKELQSQYEELEAKFFEERAALEAKYQKLYEPLYSKRYEIVNGILDIGSEESQKENSPQENKEEVNGVPEFWLKAMTTNEVLTDLITDKDEEALMYLKDIKWCRIDNPKGFRLEFFFDKNPYFKNSVLMKTYYVIEDDEPIFERAIGMEIDWYPGKCSTKKLIKRQPKKGAKNAKPVIKAEKCESFFNFFDPPQVPDDVENIDKETAEQLHNLFELDYSLGSTIRDKIIPNAVSWFTGEACQLDEFEDDDEDDEYDEEDDGDVYDIT